MAFEVTEESSSDDRGLRNALEHYDERLDEYLLDPNHGSTVELRINATTPHFDDDAFVLWNVDVEKRQVEILGTSYSYAHIMTEMERILVLADRFMEAGCRLPSTD